MYPGPGADAAIEPPPFGLLVLGKRFERVEALAPATIAVRGRALQSVDVLRGWRARAGLG